MCLLKVKHLRTKYKVLDIEVDGGVGIPTIDAAAQVPLDTVTILWFCSGPVVSLVYHVDPAQPLGSSHCVVFLGQNIGIIS